MKSAMDKHRELIADYFSSNCDTQEHEDAADRLDRHSAYMINELGFTVSELQRIEMEALQ